MSRRGDGDAPAGVGLDGADAREHGGTSRRERRPALRVAGQAARPCDSRPWPRRAAEGSVHHGHCSIGIGETRDERIEALLAIAALHRRYGHIQEIIIQNFVPKPGTIMAHAPAADREELLWSIAAARIVLGAHMSIQAPPNLSPAPLPELIAAGINDWGGVSPLTPDYVNPETPWPEIERLRSESERGGKTLVERLTIYPGVRQVARRVARSGHAPPGARAERRCSARARGSLAHGPQHRAACGLRGVPAAHRSDADGGAAR